MFIPRQLQKSTASGTRPAPKRKLPIAASTPLTTAPNPPVSTPTPTSEPPAKKPKPEIDHTVAKELVLSLEQLLSSLNPHTPWLQDRHRELDGHTDYIHLMSLVDCPYLAHSRPPITQALLRKALVHAPSDVLQVSEDGYHLRLRDPFTRRQLEDSHTVYIEPSVSGITLRPGQVARQMHQTLPERLQPVRFVQSGGKYWALVTLAGEVREAEGHGKEGWWPRDWIVLRKEEWRKREREYVEWRKRCLQERVEARQAAQEEAAGEGAEECEGGVEEEYQKGTVEVDAPEETREEETWYTKGLLVRVLHLHPGTNKNTIRGLLDGVCEKYAKNQREKRPDKKLPTRAEIQYIDYTKGLDTATVRVKMPEDAALIVDALKKRRRVMEKEDDVKGRKGEKEETWVSGEVLEGEVERRYWEGIEAAKAPKGRKRGKKR